MARKKATIMDRLFEWESVEKLNPELFTTLLPDANALGKYANVTDKVARDASQGYCEDFVEIVETLQTDTKRPTRVPYQRAQFQHFVYGAIKLGRALYEHSNAKAKKKGETVFVAQFVQACVSAIGCEALLEIVPPEEKKTKKGSK